MKAVTIRKHGGPEAVEVRDVPDPQAAPGEVVIEVRAAALNHLDLWVRNGRPGMTLKFPHILGSDASGVVAEAGRGVKGVEPGQEVIVNPVLSCGRCAWCLRGEQSECPDFSVVGLGRPGTFARRVAVPAANVYPKPAHLDFVQAAALPLAHLTAWRMLMTRARVRPGETVLVHGIGGGVALAGLQIARLAGAAVLATSSSDEKLDRARALGAAHTLNYRTDPDVAHWARGITEGRGVDVVMDTVGAATWPVDFQAVRRGGRIVLCGVTTGPAAETPLNLLYWNQISVLGSTSGSAEDFRLMRRSVAAAHLVPVLDRVYPLAKAPEAMARMEEGRQFGKIVLQVSG
jgi:NADPH:quinone reductase-like Zn-dependent oxidoreductase